MEAHLAERRVAVLPFTQQPDGEDVIIANAARSAFLAVSPEAVEIVAGLAAGLTVGEVCARYEARYGERPDVDELLDVLQREGFVAPAPAPAPAAAAPGETVLPAGSAGARGSAARCGPARSPASRCWWSASPPSESPWPWSSPIPAWCHRPTCSSSAPSPWRWWRRCSA